MSPDCSHAQVTLRWLRARLERAIRLPFNRALSLRLDQTIAAEELAERNEEDTRGPLT